MARDSKFEYSRTFEVDGQAHDDHHVAENEYGEGFGLWKNAIILKNRRITNHGDRTERPKRARMKGEWGNKFILNLICFVRK